MKKSTFYLFVVLITIIVLAGVSCSKNNAFVKPASMAQFGGAMLNLAFENNLPSGVYPIPLGLTASSKNDVTVSISVFSPTGAANGKEYTLKDSSVTIKAGSVSDTSLHIVFDTSYYLTGRTDTLILSINSVSNGVLAFNEAKTLVLVISNNCPLILSEYGGVYDIVKDPWADFIQNGYTNTIVTIVNDSTLSFPSPLTKAPIFVKVNRLTNELSVNDIDGSYGSYGKGTVAVTNSGGVALNYISSPCEIVKMIYLNLTYNDPTYGVNANYVLVLQKE